MQRSDCECNYKTATVSSELQRMEDACEDQLICSYVGKYVFGALIFMLFALALLLLFMALTSVYTVLYVKRMERAEMAKRSIIVDYPISQNLVIAELKERQRQKGFQCTDL
ncbi:hypothetical protein Ciccas_003752 [Cichlidogyrus casuarinus]|uniref:Uncharacterized protein n=1 Tax=Cichlidogyrus casuarinus TaxID=1844966 RepID=A0ABD2QDI5_9PLAT